VHVLQPIPQGKQPSSPKKKPSAQVEVQVVALPSQVKQSPPQLAHVLVSVRYLPSAQDLQELAPAAVQVEQELWHATHVLSRAL
jgi:hypothetical protein